MERITDNLRKWGNEPFRIVVVHGGPGAGGEMAPVARHLSEKRGVLEPIQTETTVDGQIRELTETISKYGSVPVTLIGYSWGAWLSVMVASVHPDLVKKLILVGSGPFEERYVEKFRETLDSRLTEQERTELAFVRASLPHAIGEEKSRLFERLGELSDKSYQYAPIPPDPEDECLLSNSAEINQSVWHDAKKMRINGTLLQYLTRIQCPVVAIHGDYDPHPWEGVTEPLSKHLDNVRYVLLNKCGHTPWIEKHARDEFYTIIEEELE